MHLNALYDLQKHTYTDALIQPVYQKDEFRAYCGMVDRHATLPGTKDIHPKGLVENFDFPEKDSFDIQVNVTLVRSHKKTIPIREGFYKRFVDADASFNYAAYGSMDTYDLSLRSVRYLIADDSYECIVINLPADQTTSNR